MLDFTLYKSINGGSFSIVSQHTTATSAVVSVEPGEVAQFYVRAADKAGNVELPAAGVRLPSYNPKVNLGALPTAESLESAREIPITNPPDEEESFTNPLFYQATTHVPSQTTSTGQTTFATIYEPFVGRQFADAVCRDRELESVRWGSRLRQTERCLLAAAQDATACGD